MSDALLLATLEYALRIICSDGRDSETAIQPTLRDGAARERLCNIVWRIAARDVKLPAKEYSSDDR